MSCSTSVSTFLYSRFLIPFCSFFPAVLTICTTFEKHTFTVMDGFTLRCNNLRCRAQLELRAAVTTCRQVTNYIYIPVLGGLLTLDWHFSHIFCISCASSLQLTNPQLNGARVCPACDTTLSAPDDAVITVLNPSDDYKTSVLGGLSPTIILEICSKGLGFWTYQVTQEV